MSSPKGRSRRTQITRQMQLFDLAEYDATTAALKSPEEAVREAIQSGQNDQNVQDEQKKTKNSGPATLLMKKVAEKAPNMRNMKKVFTKEEMDEILAKIENKEVIGRDDRIAVKELYRKIKRQVKDMEVGNNSRLILFPSLTSGQGWYKMMDFSALYYVYRLAERMGRGARIYNDSDKFVKAPYIASLQNIDKFVEQFYNLEGTDPEITQDGIYIFTLKRALTDDEVGGLRRIESVRRDKMHNILRPKAMDPAVFQAILMSVRQLQPRVRKLDPRNFEMVGQNMIADLKDLLSAYYIFADGGYDRKVAGLELIATVDRIMAGLTILAEMQVWPYDVSAVIGENLNEVKRAIVKEFNLNIGGNKK